MKKIYVLFLIVLFLLGIIFAPIRKYIWHNSDNLYKRETMLLCPSRKEIESNPKLLKKAGCVSANLELYSQKDIDYALDFAKKIKYAYRNQDLNYFANILVYPININQNGITTTINSKKELAKYNKKDLLSKEKFDEINQNRLFNNYLGFMIGNGLIWFWSENGISNIIINL